MRTRSFGCDLAAPYRVNRTIDSSPGNSEALFTEMLVRSAQKLFVCIIKRKINRIKVAKNNLKKYNM